MFCFFECKVIPSNQSLFKQFYMNGLIPTCCIDFLRVWNLNWFSCSVILTHCDWYILENRDILQLKRQTVYNYIINCSNSCKLSLIFLSVSIAVSYMCCYMCTMISHFSFSYGNENTESIKISNGTTCML